MIYLYVISGIVGGVALVWLFVWLNNRWLQTTRYTVDLELGRNVKIVQLSDLHGALFGRGNSRLIAKVLEETPDFIVISGDIIHLYRERDRRVALSLVSALSAICPVVFVSGNHEKRSTGYRFFKKDLAEAGAIVLDNRVERICGITVVGLDCSSLKNDAIYKITPQDKDKILIAHMPQFIDRYASAGYGLVLSGHAHGGQWRIPFTDIGIFAPGQGLFPKLTSGIHSRGQTKMIVSRGLGNSQFPLRLFNRPEIVVITVK